MPIVAFNAENFKAIYPSLATVADVALSNYFAQAELLLDNTEASPVPYDPEQGVNTREVLLYALTCHMAVLMQRGVDSVGAVASAAEGSVNVSFVPLNMPQAAAYYAQTQCGAFFWQATANFRLGGRYYGKNGRTGRE